MMQKKKSKVISKNLSLCVNSDTTCKHVCYCTIFPFLEHYVLGKWLFYNLIEGSEWQNGYLKSNLRVVHGITWKMGLRQIEQGFSSFLAKFDEPSACSTFENSSESMAKNRQNMKKSLYVDLPSTYFSMAIWIPDTRVSGTHSATLVLDTIQSTYNACKENGIIII